MDCVIVEIPTDKIADWESFHDVFADVFGFPDFYGRNMDAWIDCMTDLDDPDCGMTKITVKRNGLVIVKLGGSADFQERCPEQYKALVECISFVNYRRVENQAPPVLALLPI